jgi:CRP-like cAMP-binding protein
MRSPGMVRGICALCSERLKDVQDLRCMGQESVPVRVATILARLEQVHGEILPFTKKEIAELAGTTIETTFRTLAQFQKKKLLSSLRGKIQILNAQALKDLSENL